MKKHWKSGIVSLSGLGVLFYYNWQMMLGVFLIILGGTLYNKETRK
jgi:hypothetical protein